MPPKRIDKRKNRERTKRCCVCQEPIAGSSAAHQVKRHDLENLFKYHCTPNAKSRIQKASRKHPDGAVVPSLVICCRHFEKHRHDVAKRKNVHLSLRRTNCLGPFLPLLSDCVESYTPESIEDSHQRQSTAA
mmetsp:Transcript_5676/g.17408  ORF Transcript_5676/g.17408 Transcript_5676/m.17408 type:complete len:132 (-) Transcript_5676:1553-1948(-)